MTRARRVEAGAHASHTAKRIPPRRLRGSRRGLLTVTVLALSLLSSTGAYAFWTGTGAGFGTAGTGTTVPLVLTPGTVTSSLNPGGSAAVAVTISNPNTFIVRIDSFTLDATHGTAAGFTVSNAAACALGFTTQTKSGGWLVPAKVGSVNGQLALSSTTALQNAITMGASAASACQSATINVFIAADYLRTS